MLISLYKSNKVYYHESAAGSGNGFDPVLPAEPELFSGQQSGPRDVEHGVEVRHCGRVHPAKQELEWEQQVLSRVTASQSNYLRFSSETGNSPS